MKKFLIFAIFGLSSVSAQASTQPEAAFKIEPTISFRNVISSAWSPDGKYLAVHQHDNGSITVVNPFKPDMPPIFTVYKYRASEITVKFSWSPDGKFLGVQYVEAHSLIPTLQVYDVQAGKLIYELLPRKKYPSWFSDWLIKGQWSPDSRHILFYSSSRGTAGDEVPENLFVVDITKPDGDKIIFKSFVETSRDENSNFMHIAQWSPDGKFIVGAHIYNNYYPRFYIFDPFSGKQIFEFIPTTPANKPCSIQHDGAKWSPNSRWLLASFQCSGVSTTNLILDPTKKDPAEALVASYQSERSRVSWTPDSQKLWSFTNDIWNSDLTLISVVDGHLGSQKKYTLRMDIGGSMSTLLSPNGRFLFYSESLGYGRPGGLKIFDLEKEKIVFDAPSLTMMSRDFHWSPDSKTISVLDTGTTGLGNFLIRFSEKK